MFLAYAGIYDFYKITKMKRIEHDYTIDFENHASYFQKLSLSCYAVCFNYIALQLEQVFILHGSITFNKLSSTLI